MAVTRSQKGVNEHDKVCTNGDHVVSTKSEAVGRPRTSNHAIGIALLVVIVSYVTLPETLQPVGKPTVQHVWYFGWISALSTGLGVIPLAFAPNLNTFWVGVSNGECFGTLGQ